jgi:type I restriction enzyme S subunit
MDNGKRELVKAGWQKKMLGEVCGFVRGPFGGSLKKSVFVEDGFAVYEQQHAIYNQFEDIRYFINEAKFREMQRFEVHPDDLIMSCSGTMGRVAIVPSIIRRGIINQALLKLTPSKAVSPEFLKYWMDSPDFQDSLREQSGGAAIQNVASVGILKEIGIPLPPLSEQRRIVGTLDEAFESIAAAKASAEKNLQNARALFESHLQSVFTQRGEGWVEKRLGDVARTQYGLSEAMNEGGKGYKIFRMGELQCGRLIDTGRMKYADIDRAEFEKYRLRIGDILFNRTNSFDLVGKTGIFDLPGEYCFASYLVRVLLNARVMLPELLNYFMNSGGFQESVKKKASKSINQANINATILSNENVRFPDSFGQQRSIVECLNSLRTETQRLESIYQRKLAALEELKKSLLHQAFNGEL